MGDVRHLEQRLDEVDAVPRRTPRDLLALARAKWLVGERLELGKLAEELSVGRATVFRWVGTRERLYGEVVWLELSEAYEAARQASIGMKGAKLIAGAARMLMETLLASKPMQAFIAHDPAFAMRVLISSESPVEKRLLANVEQSLVTQRDEGHIDPAMDLHDLAFVVVRIAESFMYRDVISGGGERPDIAAASLAIEILVSSSASAKRQTKGAP